MCATETKILCAHCIFRSNIVLSLNPIWRNKLAYYEKILFKLLQENIIYSYKLFIEIFKHFQVNKNPSD